MGRVATQNYYVSISGGGRRRGPLSSTGAINLMREIHERNFNRPGDGGRINAYIYQEFITDGKRSLEQMDLP